MARRIDLLGQEFGRLVVAEDRGRNRNGMDLWFCNCSCGGSRTVSGASLKNGRIWTCGRCAKQAATICKTDGCESPVKRNVHGRGMGYCEPHYGSKGTRYQQPGTRYQARDGYIRLKLADGRTIGEHRAVMEQILGRRLLPGESIHHKNGVRDDNRPENLEVWFSPQPYGQRVRDLLDYAVAFHREALVELLAKGSTPLPGQTIEHSEAAA